MPELFGIGAAKDGDGYLLRITFVYAATVTSCQCNLLDGRWSLSISPLLAFRRHFTNGHAKIVSPNVPVVLEDERKWRNKKKRVRLNEVFWSLANGQRCDSAL